eukprot:758866-Hanusia_phi.AAC.4
MYPGLGGFNLYNPSEVRGSYTRNLGQPNELAVHSRPSSSIIRNEDPESLPCFQHRSCININEVSGWFRELWEKAGRKQGAKLLHLSCKQSPLLSSPLLSSPLLSASFSPLLVSPAPSIGVLPDVASSSRFSSTEGEKNKYYPTIMLNKRVKVSNCITHPFAN